MILAVDSVGYAVKVIQYDWDAVCMGEWGILKIGKAYHHSGFFNETEKTPRFPRPQDLSESSIILECVGSTASDTIEATVRYKNKIGTGSWINLHHKARIYGGRRLARWFEANIGLEEDVRIEAVEPLKRYRVTDLKAATARASWSKKPGPEIGGNHRASESSRRGGIGPATTASKFEEAGREVMEETLGPTLQKRALPAVPRFFDAVSGTMNLEAGEREYLGRIEEKLSRVQGILAKGSPDGAPRETRPVYDRLADIKRALGNFNNDVSFVGALMAKEFLLRRHRFSRLDISAKAQGAAGLDIDERTIEGERVVAEIKTTIPYGGKELGAAQKTTFGRDFRKLSLADARFKYFFVTEKAAFETVLRRFQRDLQDVTVVLLPHGIHDTAFVRRVPAA